MRKAPPLRADGGDSAKRGQSGRTVGVMTGMVTRAFVGLAAGSMLVGSGMGGPASAGSGSASLAGVQVSYTVPDRVSFDGPGCASVPWTVSWTKPDNRGLSWELEVRQHGSSSYEDSESDYLLFWDSSGSATGTLCVGRYDGYDPSQGPMFIRGGIEVRDDKTNVLGTADFPTTAVGIDRNRSRFTGLTVRPGTIYTKLPVVKGKVVAQTRTRGTMGAGGELAVEVKRNGKWRVETSSVTPDKFGRFSTTIYGKVPRGTKARVRLSGCGWCTDAKATATAR